MVTKTRNYAVNALFKQRDTGSFNEDSPPASLKTMSYGGNVFQYTESVTFEDTDWDYRALIRNKQSATSEAEGYRYTLHRKRSNPGYAYAYQRRWNPGTSKWEARLSRFEGNSLQQVPVKNVLSTSVVKNDASKKWLVKARSKQRSFMAGVALGEIAPTIRMIRRPYAALFQAQWKFADKINNLSRRQLIYRHTFQRDADMRGGSKARARARRLTANLSSAWLESTMGWGPLYSDIHGLTSALAQKFASQPTARVIVRPEGYTKTSGSALIGTIPDAVHGGFILDRFASQVSKQSCHITGAIKILDNRVAAAAGVHVRDLIQDLVPTVWDLLPYTAFLDYFLDIQNVIEASQVVSSDIAWANMTEYFSTRWQDTYVFRPPAHPGALATKTFYTRPMRRDISRVDFIRTKYTGAYVPQINFRIPGSAKKWANLAALAATFALGGRPPESARR